MKYIKMLGLLAVAAAALMAFAGTASATTLTSPAGTSYTGTIAATAGETTLHGVSTITCQKSTVEGNVETHGSDPTTASGKITHLAFEECNNPVTVISFGSLTVHTDGSKADGNGILTSSGARVLIHITGLGITCTFGTTEEATSLGTVTGGTPAVLKISATIKRESGHDGIFCGSSGLWTGTYTVNKPSTLLVD